MSEDIRARLEEYYVQIDSSVRITELMPINDGWETEIYSFTRTQAGHSESLILRMYPGADASKTCQRESSGMLALHRKDYPVPLVTPTKLIRRCSASPSSS